MENDPVGKNAETHDVDDSDDKVILLAVDDVTCSKRLTVVTIAGVSEEK